MILFFSDHTVFIVFPDHSMEYFELCQKKYPSIKAELAIEQLE